MLVRIEPTRSLFSTPGLHHSAVTTHAASAPRAGCGFVDDALRAPAGLPWTTRVHVAHRRRPSPTSSTASHHHYENRSRRPISIEATTILTRGAARSSRMRNERTVSWRYVTNAPSDVNEILRIDDVPVCGGAHIGRWQGNDRLAFSLGKFCRSL